MATVHRLLDSRSIEANQRQPRENMIRGVECLETYARHTSVQNERTGTRAYKAISFITTAGAVQRIGARF